MLRESRIVLWRLTALIALAAGFIGVLLPVLPTIPFVIVAAWAGGKGWPRFEQWLLQHATFGHRIRAWRERGVVPRPAKKLATAAMCASAVGLQFLPIPLLARIGIPVIMLIVGLWLWRRPEA